MGSFFHTPKPRHFNFRPRFYDPDKEDLELREQRIKEELGIATEKKIRWKITPRQNERIVQKSRQNSVENIS